MRRPSREHLRSLKAYAWAVGRHWLFFAVFVGAGAVGLAQSYWTTLALPTWGWLSIAGAGLLMAQFMAYHDVRVERNSYVNSASSAAALNGWIANGISLRQKLVEERPGEEAMRGRLNEWLVRIQGEAEKECPQRLPDIQAAIVESLNAAKIGDLSMGESGVLIRIDHVLKTLRRYVPTTSGSRGEA